MASGYLDENGVDFDDIFELRSDVAGDYGVLNRFPEYLDSAGAYLINRYCPQQYGAVGSTNGKYIGADQAGEIYPEECEPDGEGGQFCFTPRPLPARTSPDIGEYFALKGSIIAFEQNPYWTIASTLVKTFTKNDIITSPTGSSSALKTHSFLLSAYAKTKGDAYPITAYEITDQSGTFDSATISGGYLNITMSVSRIGEGLSTITAAITLRCQANGKWSDDPLSPHQHKTCTFNSELRLSVIYEQGGGGPPL